MLPRFRKTYRRSYLRFGRAAVAVATMRGKSYLQIGSICMGIGGSIIDPAFIEEYLGMRVESVDEVEIIAPYASRIFMTKMSSKRLYAWTREHCHGRAWTRILQRSRRLREEKDRGLGIRCKDHVHHQGSDER